MKKDKFEKLKEVKESKIENYLVKEIRKLKGRAYKFESPSNAGVPDRLCFLPGGVSFLIETKRPEGKLRPLQRVQINRIKGYGQNKKIYYTIPGGWQEEEETIELIIKK